MQVSKTPREGRFSLAPALSGAAALVLVLSWLTTEHFLPWVSWHAEALTFSGVFLVSWIAALAGWRTSSPARVPIPSIALPFVLFGLVALAQVAGGIMLFGGDAVLVGFYVALCVACLTLGFNSESNAHGVPVSAPNKGWSGVELLALAFVAGGIISTVVAFAQSFDLWSNSGFIVRTELRRPGGNLGQPNQLATLLLMSVASVAYLCLRSKLRALPATATALLLFAGLAATESRSGVLSFIVLLTWWQFKRPAIAATWPRWLVPLFGLAFMLMYLCWPHLLDSLGLLDGPAESRLSQGDVRLAVWNQLLQSALQRPWWGWGILEVAEAHNAVADTSAISNPFSYSHNLVLDWIVWMGFPIALALSVASALWLWRRLKSVDRPTPWYCLAVAAPLAVHSMLELPFAYAYFLAPVLFLLGVLEGSIGTKPLLRVKLGPVLAGLLVASFALIASVTEYLAIEEDFRIVRFEQLRIGRTPADYHSPEVRMLTQLGALLKGSRIQLRPHMPADEIEQLRKLAMRYPWVATQYRYAFALALNGQQSEARRQFQVIRRQRDEKLYQKIRSEIGEQARTRYPELRTLDLP